MIVEILIFIIIILIVISLISGKKGSFGAQISFYMNKFTQFRYHLGISHREYRGYIDETKKPCKIEVLSIGFILFDIEIEFYKLIKEES